MTPEQLAILARRRNAPRPIVAPVKRPEPTYTFSGIETASLCLFSALLGACAMGAFRAWVFPW